ncbi:MAG: single-stranded-DNA-specific exonuclease RecJ [Candidatus Electrothrix sp. AR3]|nr:single-stranded-DNA-specific exonuclease RecJ [Candidatus Electrothrix sp. AR3]
MQGDYVISLPLNELDLRICEELAVQFQVVDVIAQLFYRRGYRDVESVKRFFWSDLSELPSPVVLKGVVEAVDLLVEAVDSGWQVVVHGDYDVDGVTSTVLLVDFLMKLGVEPFWHIPNRLTDNYGLTMESVTQVADGVVMPALLITADCGISSVREVRYAQELGFRVIITDHHQPLSELPQAEAVINPKQFGCTFVFKDLCGVGVVFFLLMAVRRRMVERGVWTKDTMPNLREYLDLVALGTVADVVMLVDVNRILVRAGLEVIAELGRCGVRALCVEAGLEEVSSEGIAYQLAPRINAAGRLGKAELAVDLLLSSGVDSARLLAQQLGQANVRRRELEAAVLDQAVLQSEEQINDGKVSLVLYGRDWHLGVIGIIASRMVDRYQLPALVFTGNVGGDEVKGSGRSVEGIDLHYVLEQCQVLIVRFGGHAMAAGLTVQMEDFDKFRLMFDGCVESVGCEAQQQGVFVDVVLDGREDFYDLVKGLQLMEPFGQGNVEPVFLLRDVRLEGVCRLREHLKFFLLVRGEKISGIGFFMVHLYEVAFGLVDFAFRLKERSFRGRKRLEVYAVGIWSV